MHAKPHAGDRAQGAGHVAVGDEQLQQHHRRDNDQRDDGRPERDPKQLTRLAGADWSGGTPPRAGGTPTHLLGIVHWLGRSSR